MRRRFCCTITEARSLGVVAGRPAGRRHEFAQDIRQTLAKTKEHRESENKMELNLQRGDLRRRELGGEPAGGGLVAVDQRLLGFLLACNSFDGNDREIRSSNQGDTKATKEKCLISCWWPGAGAAVPCHGMRTCRARWRGCASGMPCS